MPIGRKCTVCAHEARAEIDVLLAEGASVRKVAAQFGLTKSAVDRHRTNCKAFAVVVRLDAPDLPALTPLQPVAPTALEPVSHWPDPAEFVRNAIASTNTEAELLAVAGYVAKAAASIAAAKGDANAMLRASTQLARMSAQGLDAAERRAKLPTEEERRVDGTLKLLAEVMDETFDTLDQKRRADRNEAEPEAVAFPRPIIHRRPARPLDGPLIDMTANPSIAPRTPGTPQHAAMARRAPPRRRRG
ncbi:TPA: hypothetical protein VMX41_001797 [Streptococcus pyogenes]|nr:hypothetical protein [Streptococcus pyogenes]